MVEQHVSPGEQNEQLYEVLLQYLEAAERGQSPDNEELLARHPEFAPELKEFLETRDRIEGLAAPLRWVAQAVLDPLEPAESGPGTPAVCGGDFGSAPLTEAREFGDYTILEEIGRGGMCVVYRARHRSLNRQVALKMVRSSRLSDEDAQRRFRNEAETVAALDHPNIVPIYEVGEEKGQLFFTMKLLEGGSLKDRLEDFTADSENAARLVATVARAVGYAHRRGVLHRDLKPSNVLLDASGRPHVADFGLAKWLGNENELTQSGALLGTPSYMAPEQASPGPRPRPGAGPCPGRGPNDSVTTAADIYGLGAMLYALLTGRPPFSGPTLLLTLEQVRNDFPESLQAVNPRVDRDLETVCLKCLEKDPGRRYASAEELAADLERWLAKEPVRARRATFTRWLWLLARRHPATATLATAVAVFVPVLIATLATAVVIVGRERDRALAQEALTKTREKQVLRQLYTSDMARAYQEWRHGDVNGLKHLLSRWQPEPGGDDPRDSAWQLLAPLHRADLLFPPRVEPIHPDAIYQLALSPDGRTMATAGKDGTVRVRGDRSQVLRGHTGEVNWVAFDPRGRRLASAGDDGTARVWDVAGDTPPLVLPAHKGEAVSAAFTPDGNWLVTGGQDGLLRKWQLPSGVPGLSVAASRSRIAALALAPDGRHVATASKDGCLRVWDLETGARQFEHQLAGQAQCVAYSPDGQALAAGDIGGHLWLFGARDGELLRIITCDNGCSIESVAFSPDGKSLAYCGMQGRVRLWDRRRNELRRNLDCDNVRVWCIAYSPDGRFLHCGAADGALRTWSLANAAAARFLPAAPADQCSSLAFSRDGGTLAVADSAGVVRFWNPETCRERTDLKRIHLAGQGRFLVRYETDGDALAVCGPEGSLQRYNRDGSSLPGRLEGSARSPLSLCCRPKTSEWVECVQGAPLVRWDAASAKPIPSDPIGEACDAAVWSPDGTILAASLPGRVLLLRNGTEQIAKLKLHRKSWASPVVAFSPDGKTVAGVDYGGIIRLWATADGGAGPVLEGRQLEVRSVAFSPGGEILAGGGEDGTVIIWDVASGRELFTLTSRPGSRVFEVAFSPDGLALAALCESHDGARAVALWPASKAPINDAE